MPVPSLQHKLSACVFALNVVKLVNFQSTKYLFLAAAYYFNYIIVDVYKQRNSTVLCLQMNRTLKEGIMGC